MLPFAFLGVVLLAVFYVTHKAKKDEQKKNEQATAMYKTAMPPEPTRVEVIREPHYGPSLHDLSPQVLGYAYFLAVRREAEAEIARQTMQDYTANLLKALKNPFVPPAITVQPPVGMPMPVAVASATPQ